MKLNQKLFCLALLILVLSGCKDDEPAPSPATITTTAASTITRNSAVTGGTVVTQGGSKVTARGVCWSKATGPTIDGDHTTDGTGGGSFTSTLTGLEPGTTYYVKAYATNGVDTSYGDEISFSTPATIYDVYIAGNVRIGNNDFPAFWKNGEQTTIDEVNPGEALAIAAGDGNVSVLFIRNNNSGRYVLWTNGTETEITDGTNPAGTPVLYAVGSDVYVGFYEIVNNVRYLRLWKNSVVEDLSSGSGSLRFCGLWASDMDTFASFYDAAGLTLWKNGSVLDTYPNFSGSIGNQTLAVSNGKVYIAGATSSAAYLEDGVVHETGLTNSVATSISVDGTDVYLAGTENNSIAHYWKNGTEAPLPDLGASTTESYNIIASEGHVYYTYYGYFPVDNISRTILVKDGQVVPPFDGTNDIFAPAIWLDPIN